MSALGMVLGDEAAEEERRAQLLMKYKILRFFVWQHLPPHMQEASRPFSELAYQVAARGADPAETTVALRKLLESKDAAVRSVVAP